jgi:hypothetical protein
MEIVDKDRDDRLSNAERAESMRVNIGRDGTDTTAIVRPQDTPIYKRFAP